MPSLPRTRACRALRRQMVATGSAALLFAAPFTFAADALYNLSTSDNWVNDAAWTPAAAPGSTSGTTNTDTAAFDNTNLTGAANITVDAGRNIANLTFTITPANTFAHTLVGGSLVLSSGGSISSTGAGTATATINSPMTLNGDYTITSDAALTFSSSAATITTAPNLGAVTLNIGGTFGTAANTKLFAGLISESAGTVLSIVKSGPGTWQINGGNNTSSNTFTGGVTVKQGVLGCGFSGSFGPTAVTLGDISGSASAALSFGSNNVVTTPINVIAGSTGTLSLLRGGGFGASTLNGPITLANNLTISQNANNGNVFNINSAITGTGNLFVTALQGTGNTNLSGSINLVGTITNNGVAASPTVITGTIGANVIGITQDSPSSPLVFSGTPSYNCPVTVTQGSVVFQTKAAKSATATITASPAGTVGLGVTGADPFSDSDVDALFNNAISGLVLDSASNVGIDTGASNFTYSLSSGGTHGLTKLGSAVLTLTGANTYTGTTVFSAGTLLVSSPENPGVSGPLGNSGALVFRGGALRYSATNTFDYSARLSPVVNQAINVDTNSQAVTWSHGFGSSGTTFNKAGNGTLTLSGANTFTGSTTLTAGTLSLGSPETAGVSGPLGTSPAVNSGSIVFRGGVLQYSSTNSFDYSGRLSSATNQAFKVDTNGQSVVWASTFGSTGGSFAKSGAGTLSLPGTANTYTGITTLSAGTLEVASLGNFNSSTGSSLGLASLSGLTNIAAGGGSSTNSLQLVNDSVAKTLRYLGSGETSDRAIYIRTQSVETAIESSGSGALTLSGPISSYVPNVSTAINTSLILGGINTDENTFSGSFTELNQGAVNSAINLTKRGAGTWLLSGDKNYRGITFVEEGTLKFTSVANSGTNSSLGLGNQLRVGSSTIAGDYSIALGTASTAGTLDHVGTTASTTNRVIGLSGDGTVLNSASLPENTLTLGGAINSLTGGTKTLSLGGSNTGANTISGVISDGFGAVSLIKSGAGSWTLSGANTYSGLTSVQLGTLALSGSGSLGSAALGLSTGSTFDISALSASDYILTNGLTGSGTINATGKNLAINGAYAPGALAITGNVIFDGGATSTFVATKSMGVSSLTDVTGSVQNAGALTINPAPSFTFAANDSFILVSASEGITPGYSSVTVDSLPLANSSVVWSAVSGDLRYTYTESNGTLTVASNAPLSALLSWRETYFGTTENAGTAADSADFDHDGIPNLVEYATSTDPTLATAPVILLSSSGSQLSLTFPTISDPALTYTVQGRDDLVAGNWTTVVPVEANNPSTGTGATVTVIDPAVLSPTQTKRFLRLSISVTP